MKKITFDRIIQALGILSVMFGVYFLLLTPDKSEKPILKPANELLGCSSVLVHFAPKTLLQARKTGFMSKYYPYLKSVCQDYQVPVMLVMNLIYTESRFIHSAKSNKNCHGYMQLNPINTQGKILSPEDNLLCGVAFLSSLYKKFGNWPDALNFYGSGYKMCSDKKTIRFILNTK